MNRLKVSSSNLIYYIVCRTFILLCISNFATNAQSTETVEVYKCSGSELAVGHEILVPSYQFDSQVILRIKSPFQGCGKIRNLPKSTEVQLIFNRDLVKHPENLTISNKMKTQTVSISPQGILNVGNNYYDINEYCVLDYMSGSGGDSLLTIQHCPVNCSDTNKHNIICIRKCCPVGKVVHADYTESERRFKYRCLPSGNISWNGFLYDENSWDKRAKMISGRDTFKKPHYFTEIMTSVCNQSGFQLESWIMRKHGIPQRSSTSRLLTNGRLIFISDQRKWTLLDESNQFCIDGIQNVEQNSSYSGDESDQVVFACVSKSSPKPDGKLSLLYMYILFLASVFYLATAIVYILLWDKQTTKNWAEFSLVLSQFGMCLFIGGAHRLGLYKGTTGSLMCISNAILAHFFVLATFSWLMVINFDLWSTFRSLRPKWKKKVDLTRISLYSLVGWGIPVTVVSTGVVLQNLYPDRESLVIVPEYGMSICYLVPYAQGFYIYYIMAVLLGISLILSMLSCVNIYEFHRGGASARSSSSAENRNIFHLYGKLSIILGTSWIFEFISWLANSTAESQHWAWVIFDVYNLLTAVFVFIIFACKKSNLDLLADKYPRLKPVNDLIDSWKSGRRSQRSGNTDVITLSARSSRGENVRGAVQCATRL